MAVLPDPAASRCLLVGVHTYSSPELDALPAVENNLARLREAFTDPGLWGLPPDHCTVLSQPQTAESALDTIHALAEQTEDTLLVYFAGHGMTHPGTRELYLALPHSVPGRLYTALRYEDMRQVILHGRSGALRTIVILDCCYSGRALIGGMSARSQVAEELSIEGTYLLTATAENREALSPPGEPLTARCARSVSRDHRASRSARAFSARWRSRRAVGEEWPSRILGGLPQPRHGPRRRQNGSCGLSGVRGGGRMAPGPHPSPRPLCVHWILARGSEQGPARWRAGPCLYDSPGRNGSAPGPCRWGGWDSNPRPTDYESAALTG